jgi:hypothetical protein
MKGFYKFSKKQSELELLSEHLEKGDKEKAQETLVKIINECASYMKKNNLENEIDRPLRIYIAGPYTPNNASAHDYARIAHENTVNAINFGIDTIDRGHIPYIPHLSHFVHLYGKKTLSYDYYTKADIEWLKDCDAILYYHPVIGDSKGADNELKIAIDSGKMVFFSINEIPKYMPTKKKSH